MIRGAPLRLLALVAAIVSGAKADRLGRIRATGEGKGAGRYRWERNSFFEARRQGRRRAARNRRKAARAS